jgi:phosphoenolpyruvate carboxykinase (GTP)
MLIMSLTNLKGEEKFIVAAFPSACGKRSLSKLTPTISGYTVRLVGDGMI